MRGKYSQQFIPFFWDQQQWSDVMWRMLGGGGWNTESSFFCKTWYYCTRKHKLGACALWAGQESNTPPASLLICLWITCWGSCPQVTHFYPYNNFLNILSVHKGSIKAWDGRHFLSCLEFTKAARIQVLVHTALQHCWSLHGQVQWGIWNNRKK